MESSFPSLPNAEIMNRGHNAWFSFVLLSIATVSGVSWNPSVIFLRFHATGSNDSLDCPWASILQPQLPQGWDSRCVPLCPVLRFLPVSVWPWTLGSAATTHGETPEFKRRALHHGKYSKINYIPVLSLVLICNFPMTKDVEHFFFFAFMVCLCFFWEASVYCLNYFLLKQNF